MSSDAPLYGARCRLSPRRRRSTRNFTLASHLPTRPSPDSEGIPGPEKTSKRKIAAREHETGIS